jgi:hypothetical protein
VFTFDPSILDDLPDYTPEECFVGSLEYAEHQAELTDYDLQMLRLALQGIAADLEPETWGYYDMRISSLEIRHGLGG